MKSIFLLLALAAAPAHAVDFDVGLHLGAGRIAGATTDYNQVGFALATDLSLQLHNYISIRSFFHFQSLNVFVNSGPVAFDGLTLLSTLSAVYHPLGVHGRWRPFLGIEGGVGVLRIKSRGSTPRLQSLARGYLAGGNVGVLVSVSDSWSVGPSFRYLAFLAAESCVAVDDDFVACGADSNIIGKTGYASLTLAVNYRL